MDVAAVQAMLADEDLDGWLLTDFRDSNPPARRILGVRSGSRRWFYWIPREGVPTRIEPMVDEGVLSDLPGPLIAIISRRDAEAALGALLSGCRSVAMEYSPSGANPYVGRVDAGTVEWVRGLGVEVASSQELLQHFEARWTDAQWQSHLAASRALLRAIDGGVELIRRAVSEGEAITEHEVSAAIGESLRQDGCTGFDVQNTSATRHTMLPHYTPPAQGSAVITSSDLVLMDCVARVDRPDTVYADYTRVFYVGDDVPDKYEEAFRVAAHAREAVLAMVRDSFASRTPVRGCDLDRCARDVVESAGLLQYVRHRTGHNLGANVHGNGAHLDSVEMPDERLIIAETAFTIEPGLYLKDFGVRTEINVYVDAAREVQVTGKQPMQIETILA